MKRTSIFPALLTLSLLIQFAKAQIPPISQLEDRIDITSFGKPSSVYADNYGTHAAFVNAGSVVHRLFKSDGTEFAGFSGNLTVSDAKSPVISSSNRNVYVAMLNGAETKIKLRLTVDGGASWIPLGDFDIPVEWQVPGAVLDATADNHGVHVVWSYGFLTSSPVKIHYIRYNPQIPGWVAHKEVTNIASSSTHYGARAKVRTFGNKAVVAYINTAANSQLASRDLLDIPSDSWATDYQVTTDALSFRSVNLSVTTDGVFTAGSHGYTSGLGGAPRFLSTRTVPNVWNVTRLINNFGRRD